MKKIELNNMSKVGFTTLYESIRIFYSHISFIIISFIPSSVRALQMWLDQTPIWSEAVVFITRIILFIMMIVLLTKSSFQHLRQQKFWDQLLHTMSKHLETHWPYGFLAQIVIFIVFLYGLGNLIIMLISKLITLLVASIYTYAVNTDAFYNATLYFLKNMTVIPLSLVFVLIMLGVGYFNKN